LTLYRTHVGCPVYLRPTDSGFTVLSLDHRRCSSMIGVGGRGTRQHVLTRLPPGEAQVLRAWQGYQQKLASLRRGSEEERFALRIVARALEDGLRLPGGDLFFLHQEWRLPQGGRLDLLAVRPSAQRLVVIELKGSQNEARRHDHAKGGDAWDQARGYAAEIHRHRGELYPFFQRLARVMGRHHNAPRLMREVVLAPEQPPEVCVLWPD